MINRIDSIKERVLDFADFLIVVRKSYDLSSENFAEARVKMKKVEMLCGELAEELEIKA